MVGAGPAKSLGLLLFMVRFPFPLPHWNTQVWSKWSFSSWKSVADMDMVEFVCGKHLFGWYDLWPIWYRPIPRYCLNHDRCWPSQKSRTIAILGSLSLPFTPLGTPKWCYISWDTTAVSSVSGTGRTQQNWSCKHADYPLVVSSDTFRLSICNRDSYQHIRSKETRSIDKPRSLNYICCYEQRWQQFQWSNIFDRPTGMG